MKKKLCNIPNSLVLKYLATTVYAKYYNIGSTEEIVYSKKKEGLVNLYTLDTGEGLNKIMDGRHLQSRRWIKRRKKRSLSALKELKRRTFFFSGCSVIISRKKEILSAHLEQNFKLKAFLPFNNYSYSSHYVLNMSHFFVALNRRQPQSLLFLLKPIKGGFKMYFEGALGFFRKRQGKKLFKVLAKDYRYQVKKKRLIHKVSAQSIFSKPILCCYFPKFRVKCKFAGFYRKKKFVKAKVRKFHLIRRGCLKFVFRFFKLKSKYNWKWKKKWKKKNNKKKNLKKK